MTRRAIQLLADGESIDEIYMVSDKQLRTNRQGNFFLQLELRDRTGSISARLWNANEVQFKSFNDGDFLRIKGKVQLFQGALQILFTGFERVDPSKLTLDDFVPRAEMDIHKLYDCHDLIVEHKAALFDHLTRRWKDLFNAQFDVLLYDLTSTYCESDPPFPRRRRGFAIITRTSAACSSTLSRCSMPPTVSRRSIPISIATC